jgi:hypothetical protein
MTANDMIDQIVRGTTAKLWSDIKTYWPSLWPYVIGFAIFIIGGMILQILMLHGGRYNKLSPAFNSMVGSLVWMLFSGLLIGISYLIFGPQVIDELWFGVFGAVAFVLTRGFLVAIGFWYY